MDSAFDIFVDVIFTLYLILYRFVESFVSVFLPSKKKDVSGDVVLVTGTGSGLGRLTAIEFAKLGAVVVLWDVNEKDNLETAELIEANGGKAYAYTCNLSNRNEVYKTAEKVKSQVGVVTILVNNAGIVTGKKLLECPDHMIEKTFAVNTLAHFWTVKAFLPEMLRLRKGHIVTIASMAGYFGISQLVDYSSSKSAAIGFNNSLTAELRANGFPQIQTTVVCPVFINTGMFDGVQSKFFPVLTPERVVADIMKSILTNTREIRIPRNMSVYILLRQLVPLSVFDVVHDVTVNKRSTMGEFKGRSNTDINNKTN